MDTDDPINPEQLAEEEATTELWRDLRNIADSSQVDSASPVNPVSPTNSEQLAEDEATAELSQALHKIFNDRAFDSHRPPEQIKAEGEAAKLTETTDLDRALHKIFNDRAFDRPLSRDIYELATDKAFDSRRPPEEKMESVIDGIQQPIGSDEDAHLPDMETLEASASFLKTTWDAVAETASDIAHGLVYGLEHLGEHAETAVLVAVGSAPIYLLLNMAPKRIRQALEGRGRVAAEAKRQEEQENIDPSQGQTDEDIKPEPQSNAKPQGKAKRDKTRAKPNPGEDPPAYKPEPEVVEEPETVPEADPEVNEQPFTDDEPATTGQPADTTDDVPKKRRRSRQMKPIANKAKRVNLDPEWKDLSAKTQKMLGRLIDPETEYQRQRMTLNHAFGEPKTQEELSGRLALMMEAARQFDPESKAKQDLKWQRYLMDDIVWRNLSGGKIVPS